MCCRQPGDLVVVDGGMVSLEVDTKMGPDVHCRVVDPGIILSRANLTFRRDGAVIRARNSMLPVLSSKARARGRRGRSAARARAPARAARCGRAARLGALAAEGVTSHARCAWPHCRPVNGSGRERGASRGQDQP